MSLLARAAGLLRAPDATWAAIAAEGDTRRWLLRTYLPAAAMLPSIVVMLLWLALGYESEVQTMVRSGPGADGPMTERIVTLTMPSRSVFAVMSVVMLVPTIAYAVLTALLMRNMLLQAAPRHGAPADPVAALKLAAYGQTGFWLAGLLGALPMVGVVGWLAGLAYGFWLLRRGGVLLLPPAPGRESALRWTVTWRAIFASVLIAIALGFLCLLIGAVLVGIVGWSVLQSLVPALPLPGAREISI